MLTTIEGTYDNGRVLLDEKPPFSKKTKVLITFLEEDISEKQPKKLRKAGRLAGQIWTADDFNEPLDDLEDYQ